MRVLAAAKCKATFLNVLTEVEERREPVTVTKNGRPVAMVVPLPKAKSSLDDYFIGRGEMHADIVGPIVDSDEYEALR